MVIAGSDRVTRRRGVRRQRDPFSHLGLDLAQARERAGLSLEAVQDRTGVRRVQLEALEDGDLSRFPDEAAALVAVRRYAEILGLDAATMAQIVSERLRNVGERAVPVLVGAATSPAPDRRPTGPVPAVAGHLSRYPGDSSHLRAFTQTAQVPQVGPRPVRPSLPPGLRFDSTDAIPVTYRDHPDPHPAPLALRVAVWSTVLLLIVGVAGLAVHHWRPAWLTKIHLVAGPPARGAHASHGASRPSTGVHGPVVKQTASGPLSAEVTVRSPVFAVVVTTGAPCWIHVSSPASFAPVFSSTVPAGTTKTFTSASGQLSVELGASHASVTVQVLGKTVPGWVLTPSAAPFVVNFHSARA
ncbi:MAG TPA: helix-turn-helix domain-containing protein [Acidimicrobiales bacterium]|nr:helix-turn-helix domain-containing protein [Acidimicrobiales bacterium]